MSGAQDSPHRSLTPVRDEMLEVSLSLPTGWSAQVEPGSDVLTCVADDDLDQGGLRPSITVERHRPVAWEELVALARGVLDDMERTYDGFELRWAREDAASRRALRAYAFTMPELGRRVRQVQGLVVDEALFVVNCTEPVEGPRLEDVFVAVVESLTSL